MQTYATADFRVHGTGWNGEPYEATVHAELRESAAFQYGNQTCMSLKWSDRPRADVYDTRYSKVSAKNFTEFAKAELDAQTLDTITVEVIG